MTDEGKTRERLLEELETARRQIAELVSSRAQLESEAAKRKHVERALRESEAQKRAILNGISTNIAFVNRNLEIQWLNKVAADSVGKTPEEMIGTKCHAHWADPDKPCEGCPSLRAFETMKSEHTTMVTPDGRVWDEGGEPVFDDQGDLLGVVEVATDITERKRAEETLRESEEKYRAITDTALDSIFCKDLDSRFTFVNPAMERLFGRPARELLGLTPRELFDEQSAAIVEAVDAPVFLGQVSKAIRTLNIQGEDRTFHTIQVPTRGAGGEVTGICGIVRDITDAKRAEEQHRKLEARVRQAQKLESLGILASGIAHDFNNILTGLLGNADLALCDLPSHSPIRPLIQGIQQAARRAADLTNQMLAYSGKGTFVVDEIDVNALVRDLASLLQSAVSKKAELGFDLSADLPGARADATQLAQIVLNLVSNASEAIGDEDGLVRIRTSTTDWDHSVLDAAGLVEGLAEGRYVTIEVSDTGGGMDDETKARVFDPFFTTKLTGRGLGLAVVQGIVRGHQGAIVVESELGKGTTFKVLLPALDHAAAPVAARAEEENDWQGAGTVLLVDDEEMVRNVVAHMLELLGFSVLTASDGAEAVELFRERHDEIACVLLDLTMPRMDGEETFRELRRISDDVRVILSSGYGEQVSTERFGATGLAGFLQKPYEVARLKEKLREVGGD